MLLHTIAPRTFKELRWQGLTLTHELVHFSKFILAEIFPGGWLPTVPTVEEHAAKAGFTVTRIQSLQPYYARTLETWAAALRANQEEAIAMSKPIWPSSARCSPMSRTKGVATTRSRQPVRRYRAGRPLRRSVLRRLKVRRLCLFTALWHTVETRVQRPSGALVKPKGMT